MTNERPDIHDEPAEPATVRPWEDLPSTGLLWLLNSACLHPRGFALALVRREGEIVGWKLLGDGTEPWKFAGVEDGSCDANFAAVEALFNAARPPSTGGQS